MSKFEPTFKVLWWNYRCSVSIWSYCRVNYIYPPPRRGRVLRLWCKGVLVTQNRGFLKMKYPEDGSNFNTLRTGSSNINNTTITSNWYTTTYNSIILWTLAQICSPFTSSEILITRAEIFASVSVSSKLYTRTYHSTIT